MRSAFAMFAAIVVLTWISTAVQAAGPDIVLADFDEFEKEKYIAFYTSPDLKTCHQCRCNEVPDAGSTHIEVNLGSQVTCYGALDRLQCRDPRPARPCRSHRQAFGLSN